AELTEVPGQVPVGAAALDDAVVPVVPEHFRRDPRRARVRVRAEVAHAGVDVPLAVGGDAHEAAEPAAARRVVRRAHADAAHLGAVALPAAGLARLPAEGLRALLERLAQVRARQAGLVAAVLPVARRRVDAADLETVHAQPARGLV